MTELLADATERGATLGLEFQPAASGWRLRVSGVGSLDAPIDPALAVSRLDVIRAVATVSPDADGLVIEPLAGQSSGP